MFSCLPPKNASTSGQVTHVAKNPISSRPCCGEPRDSSSSSDRISDAPMPRVMQNSIRRDLQPRQHITDTAKPPSFLFPTEILPGDILLRTCKDIDGSDDFPTTGKDKMIQRGQRISKIINKNSFVGGSVKTVHVAICIKKADDNGGPIFQVAEASGARGVRIGEGFEGFYKVIRSVNPAVAQRMSTISEQWILNTSLKYSKYNAATSVLRKLPDQNPQKIQSKSGRRTLYALLQNTKEGDPAPFKSVMCSEFVAACLAVSEALENNGKPLTRYLSEPKRLPPVVFESVLEQSEHCVTEGYVCIEKPAEADA
jgi:hypothetical protein